MSETSKDNPMQGIVNEEYGITILPYDGEDNCADDEYIKIDKDSFARFSAGLHELPQVLKSIYDQSLVTGTYRVVYDKGLGVLQHSAKNPDLFRANIVKVGTNNDITGQALLEKLSPTKAMKVSQIALSAYTLASIATNQYFLARIDNKMESIEAQVGQLQRFLEIDKQSQLWAEGKFLKQTSENIKYMVNDDSYCKATLVNVQAVRLSALSNIRMYYEQLQDLKKALDEKDDDKKTGSKLDKYKGYLPKYWYSVYLYETSYYLEVYLSGISDPNFLSKVKEDMSEIRNQFEESYQMYSTEINNYIDTVKSLKANTLPLKIMKQTGKILEVASITGGPLIVVGTKVVGVALDSGGDALEKHEIAEKEIKKQTVIDDLENVLKPYKDIKPLEMPIKAIGFLDDISNKPVELLISKDEAYVKCRKLEEA